MIVCVYVFITLQASHDLQAARGLYTALSLSVAGGAPHLADSAVGFSERLGRSLETSISYILAATKGSPNTRRT